MEITLVMHHLHLFPMAYFCTYLVTTHTKDPPLTKEINLERLREHATSQ